MWRHGLPIQKAYRTKGITVRSQSLSSIGQLRYERGVVTELSVPPRGSAQGWNVLSEHPQKFACRWASGPSEHQLARLAIFRELFKSNHLAGESPSSHTPVPRRRGSARIGDVPRVSQELAIGAGRLD